MNFIIIWIITYIVSLIMKIGNMLKVHKDAADLGYKIVSKNINELDKKTSNLEINDWLIFIPFVNMLYNIYEAYSYNQNKDSILYGLKMSGLLERMNIDEVKEYNNKPTAINTLLTKNKTEIRELEKKQAEEMYEEIKDYKFTEEDRKALLKYINKNFGKNEQVMEYLKSDPTFAWIFDENDKEDLKSLKEQLINEKEELEKRKEEVKNTKQKIKQYRK